MPIPLTLLMMVLALALIKRRPRTAQAILLLAVLFLGLTSWEPIANRLVATVETPFVVFDTEQSVDTIVVLGSGHQIIPNAPPVMQLGRSAIYRLEEGLRIARANPTAMLYFSGYGNGKSHAEMMREAAMELGIPSDRIKIFPKAKDTEDEARMMSPYLKDKRVALVTEASHMPRALKYFEREGIHPFPAPAFKLSSNNDDDIRIDANANYKSERAFYEWIGQAWQWIKG